MPEQLATRCGACKRKLRIPIDAVGRKFNCPSCEVSLQCPTPEEVAAALPERFVCKVLGVLEATTLDGRPHPSDPTAGSAGWLEDTLVINEVATFPSTTVDGRTLDEILETPDVDYAEGGVASYEVRDGNRLVIRNTDGSWFEQLGELLDRLPTSKRNPMMLDLRPLGPAFDAEVIQRIMFAVLSIHLAGKPIRVHASRGQRAELRKLRATDLVPFHNAGTITSRRKAL